MIKQRVPIRPVSRERLAQRRSQLKRRRQVRLVWGGWQSLAAIALLGGTVWLMSAPIWVVRSPEQIAIEGNTHLDKDQIRQLLGLTYPQSLWRLEPEAIAKGLKARAPIDEVIVTRQLLPPGLTVQIQELQPVAVVQVSAEPGAGLTEPRTDRPQRPGAVGLIDRNGQWIELSRYQQSQGGRSLPSLKLIAPPSRLAEQWPALYNQIKLAPVRISTLQWQDTNNLILETELGVIHCGPFGANFGQQLEQLANLRNLSGQIDRNTLDYIDLRDPNRPLLHTRSQPAAVPRSP